MKKILLFTTMIVIALILWIYFAPKEVEFTAQNDFEAAQMIIDEAENGNDTVYFIDSHISQEGVFRTLESLYPYAFSVKYTTFNNKRLRVTLVIEQREEQEKGIKKAREIALKIVKPDMTLKQKLEAIHNYIVLNCQYDQSVNENPSGSGDSFTATGALINGKAVCAGYSRAFLAMCKSVGIDAIYIADEEMNHGWNAVRIYGKNYFIDSTYDDPVPDKKNSVSVKYFCRTEQQLMLTHSWEREFYDSLLDTIYPENFEYIQRMSDLGFAKKTITANKTDITADDDAVKMLNDLLGTDFSSGMTYGELYKKGWLELKKKKDGYRLIDKLIFEGKTTLTLAREVGL